MWNTLRKEEYKMNKKLAKTRNSRMDTLEAMACNCHCNDPCLNCSGGGSFYVQQNIYIGGAAEAAHVKTNTNGA